MQFTSGRRIWLAQAPSSAGCLVWLEAVVGVQGSCPAGGWTDGQLLRGKPAPLFHCSSIVGPDEQRRCMVLELYCRKQREREGRKIEAGHGHTERGENVGGEREQEIRDKRSRA